VEEDMAGADMMPFLGQRNQFLEEIKGTYSAIWKMWLQIQLRPNPDCTIPTAQTKNVENFLNVSETLKIKIMDKLSILETTWKKKNPSDSEALNPCKIEEKLCVYFPAQEHLCRKIQKKEKEKSSKSHCPPSRHGSPAPTLA
jgi:hypothetical protein